MSTRPLAPVQVTDEDVQAVLECYRSGWLTMGPRTKELEERFAALLGSRHVIAVSSLTAAHHLALVAAGVGPGDEVVVSGLELATTGGGIRACGAEPVAADVLGPLEANVDPADVAARITPRTKAVLATHRWGYASDVAALRSTCEEHGIALVEDCAQALLAELADGTGGRAGTAGLAGCFSFAGDSQLPVGEGGLVVTDDDQAAARIRALRSHAMTSVTWDRHRGHAESYDVLDVGFNYRLDEPRAALGLSRLPRLADELAGRRAAVRAYRAALGSVAGVELAWPDDDAALERSTHGAFGVLLADTAARDAAREALARQGVATATVTAAPALPHATEVAARCLLLPLPSPGDETLGPAVIDGLRAASA